MGTSTMGSDLHSDKQDKLLKLQARKKELEQMLASKNEELYRLCVQEVQLTGIVPLEAPLSPDVPRERLPSVRSGERSTDGADVHDGSDAGSRRLRSAPDVDLCTRKNLCHRLSTPSLSGAVKSAPSRYPRRPDTSCSNFFPSPPQERHPETFSIHTSHTYPALAARLEPPPDPRAHYSSASERLRETHFSSSHPDIAAHYVPAPSSARTPLLYQYASQLKAQSQHLGALGCHPQPLAKRRVDGRRSTLQRTQTYHLTSHSDYSQHLDAMAPHYPSPPRAHPDLLERAPAPNARARLPLHLPLQVATDECGDPRSSAHASCYSPTQYDSVSINKFSPLSPMDGRAKEKQWYETSLDAPARGESCLRKSASLKRTPSAGSSQPYEVMMSSGRHSALQSPPVLSPGAVSLESPKNMTVIEQGKCIPYREETKPFEMSDFYKYSTKFRQAAVPKPAAPAPANAPSAMYKLPLELPAFSQDQWRGYAN